MKKITIIIIVAVTLSLAFLSCGSSSQTINLGSNDQIQFDKNELRVKVGQKITLMLTHSGQMDKNSMGHNFILLEQGVDVDQFALKAIQARDTEYIPEDKSEIIAYTSLIGGGESTSITFDAPEKGTYDYICSFPGHYALMRGKFIVE